MKSQGETAPSAAGTKPDSYAQVISGIQKNHTSTISVPQLSKLLGVKSTTLNARFRRQGTALRTIGRTTFIPISLAFDLAALHRYALLGWPTLQQASYLTGMKTGTIKARCEKGRLEGHIDLTKRLRINPAELEDLASQPADEASREPARQARGQRLRMSPISARNAGKREQAPERSDRRILQKAQPFVLGAAPEPHIRIITSKDYESLETAPQPEVRAEKRQAPNPKQKYSGRLSYDPDQPFSVSECAVGQQIRYGHYDGRILKVIHDPFSPKILAQFPDHQHPLMREVLLVVEKSRT